MTGGPRLVMPGLTDLPGKPASRVDIGLRMPNRLRARSVARPSTIYILNSAVTFTVYIELFHYFWQTVSFISATYTVEQNFQIQNGAGSGKMRPSP